MSYNLYGGWVPIVLPELVLSIIRTLGIPLVIFFILSKIVDKISRHQYEIFVERLGYDPRDYVEK